MLYQDMHFLWFCHLKVSYVSQYLPECQQSYEQVDKLLCILTMQMHACAYVCMIENNEKH